MFDVLTVLKLDSSLLKLEGFVHAKTENANTGCFTRLMLTLIGSVVGLLWDGLHPVHNNL